ncbi:MAG: ribose-phosphate diphosphokinase [Pseudomonadales bacterium]|nr:ribose-phosphate diphosphokinase [Pseudomonadales bacterium]
MIVLSFDDYHPQAQTLAAELGTNHQGIKLHRFPDGESLVQIPADLPSSIIICQSLHFPNNKLMELYLAVKTAKAQGVKEIILVAPYLCYMRQDIAFKAGQAVSQKIIGAFLGELFDKVITVDPHLHRINKLEQAIPNTSAIALTAAEELGNYVRNRFQNAVFLGPDEESHQWVSVVAQPGNNDFAVATKERLGDKSVKIHLPDYNFNGKTAVLVDDVISSGHTMAETAKELTSAGCKKIIALCTHALLAPGAEELLQNNAVEQIISTDSIPHSSNQISLAKLLASVC